MENIAFYIQGNSMTPTMHNGDMIVCRMLAPFEVIEENELYAIITTSGTVLIKRVQKIRDRNSKIIQLKLISDNDLEHNPFKIPIHNIRALLKVEQNLAETA